MSADAPTAARSLATHDVAPDLAPSARRRLSRRALWLVACAGVDVATLTAASIASMVTTRGGGVAWSFSGWTLLFSGLTLLLLARRGLYRLRIKIQVIDDTRTVVGALTLAAGIVMCIRLLLASPALATGTLRPFAFALVYVTAGRVALYWSQTKARIAGEASRPTLIVGAGRVGRTIGCRLRESRELGLEPVGYLDSAPVAVDDDPLNVLGGEDDLERLVRTFGVEHVVVTFSTASDESLLALVNRAEALGVGVSVVPRLYEKVPERLTVEHLGGLPLLTAHPTDPKGRHYAIKYAIDRVVAAVLVVLAAPVLLACALAVRLTMGRPILFRQPRVGRDGREFEMLKFRTMRGSPTVSGEADAAWLAQQLGQATDAPVFDGDQRRTPVGTLLRRASLDELPQLLNVLKGEMSIVGPRPERTSYVRRLEGRVYRYGDRHRVKAGITGWAQVHGLRGDTSLADRVEWDNFYVENFSLWLDLKILLLTIKVVLFGTNAR
jgi:exopolysaccharide biosynthesis polyprenyl glycosylphosphotransferase